MTSSSTPSRDQDRPQPALMAAGICISLAGKRVVSDVDITVHSHEITGLIGPNGAGKTTLLRALSGVLTADRGDVRLGDVSLGDLDVRARARRIAYQPQDRTIHWPLSVRALVGLGRLPHQRHGMSPSVDDKSAIAQALSRMDLDGLAERAVDTLSGGEQARVLIARALAQQTDILIADEPVAGLDPAHQLRLFEHLQQFANIGRCVIVALHDLTLAARFCHRLVLMSHGRAVCAGTPDEVLSVDRIREVYGVEAWRGDVAGEPVVLPLTISAAAAPR